MKVRARAGRLDAASLARADAAIVVIDAADAPAALAGLPLAELWKRQHRAARKDGDPPVLAARLPNRRHTLLAVGITRHGDSAFRRLELAGKLAARVLERGVASVQCHVLATHADGWRDALASALLAAAAPMPERRSTRTPPCDLRTIDVHGAGRGDPARWSAVAEGNHLARWLATLPPNELDSVNYRRLLQALARREGWSFRFYDERALARAGAGAFLAVSRANAHRGAGIVRLRHRGRGRARTPPVALVGKGICFDTGGINLKSQRGMYTMHGDMQGSGVAVGTLLACTRAGVPLDVDCWLALTENEIGPRAYRPQEVVRASNGVTIQVVHSDAEGRMVLADTLALASRERPGLVLDFATLTGACVNALTERYSGAFTNREDLHPAIVAAGRASGERVWCFPMDDDFDGEIESPIADVMQCTMDSKGDHILAARFLGRFVAPGVPWVHVDLSSSERKGGLAHVTTDFTGFGVRFAMTLLGDAGFLGQLRARE
ncbi:MAG: M17 family metallopeptidase [Steroidobacteraceae bacterium]